MNTLTLTRFRNDGDGTFGVLMAKGFACFTVEAPWKDNKPFVSCIPVGAYTMERDYTGRYKLFKVLDVPDRTGIEFHYANLPTDVKGCIGLGESYSFMYGAWSIRDSHSAISRFLQYMGTAKEASLIIKNI